MGVSVDIQGVVALIRMDDGKANAINFEMLTALNKALDKAEAQTKAIVLAGREGRFSGGFDLKVFASAASGEIGQLLDEAAELLMRLYGGPLPVVAACTGHAIAMGAFIINACDTRVGSVGDYKIGANETTNGMTLPIFALELSRDRLTPLHLTRALVQSFIYSPEGAVEAGYLDMLATPSDVETTAMALATQLASLPTAAYAANKRAVRKATLDRIRSSIGAHFG
jgi:enoyl-CoA hydratase